MGSIREMNVRKPSRGERWGEERAEVMMVQYYRACVGLGKRKSKGGGTYGSGGGRDGGDHCFGLLGWVVGGMGAERCG